MKKIIHSISSAINKCFTNIKYFFASNNIKELLKNKNIRKSLAIIIFVAFILTESFAWLYDEFAGAGALLNTGRISHNITQYDEDGIEISDNNEVQTIMYETNMSNITVGSKYIEVENTGTLDMEFSLAFSLEGHYIEVSTSSTPSSDLTQVAGILYYRLYEVTGAVNDTVLGTYDSKLEAYAASHQPSASMENDTAIPVRNMTLLNNLMKIDTVAAPVENVKSSKIYRLDYGMYSGVNTGRYSDSSLSIHLNAYSSQVGVITAENREGQILDVQNETQLREILNSAVAGDTIRLMDNINLSGTLNITKRVNLDLNGFNLNVSQDLVYEFANLGNLTINASGYGSLNVGENFILNTPKANVTIVGSENSYDVVVGGEFNVNVIQDGETDGLYLDSAHIVKSSTGLVPIDMIVDSNSRITIGPEVVVGNITAADGSTNIEVVNNGSVTQLDFSNMTLQETYTKAQIYVYNLGEIYGILGSYGILLPSNAAPYLAPNSGNTLIIKGITSGDITVGGSENFDIGDIQTNQDDISVVPIENELNSYIVYIKAAPDTLQGLLEAYFENQGSTTISQDIDNIEKLVIWTLNAQYFELEDFVYANSSAMSSLEYISLYNSRVTDGTTNNKIPNNAFLNKTTLKTVILPKTVTEIGNNAFSGVQLGAIPASTDDEFNFITIPSTVTTIGSAAFDSSIYVKFVSSVPPTLATNTFGTSARIFVPNGSISTYSNVQGISPEYLFISGNLDDDRRYFVFNTNTGLGISYVVNKYLSAAATTLGIPETITYQGSSKNVTEIGNNSFREMNIVNTSGVKLTLPDTITRIDPSAFYGLNLTAVEYFNNVTYIGDYAFYQTNLTGITANRATYIGNYAFYNTPIETIQLNNVITIDDYAFANSLNLYEASVGTLSVVGDYAFSNCPQMQRFYINNGNSLLVNNTEEIDLTVGTNAFFNNWGAYIDGRLRFYVPDATLASGKTVLSLYKEKFPDNANYIYITGIDVGSYQYMAVPYNLSNYTVRTVTVRDTNNASVTGYEIISYQGPDLTSNLPTYLTANGTTKDVVSIGEGAYQNTVVASGSEFNIESEKLINISKGAFYGFDIGHVVAAKVATIGESAFEGSTIHYGFFEKLKTLGTRAFYNCDELYRLKLGPVTEVGTLAAAETPNLTSVFFTNTLRNVNYASDAFENTGTNIANRFRMYVPDENNLLDFYRGIFTDLADYIYPTGTIIGHYTGSINYNIGLFSVREVTKQNASGSDVTDYEIIEYHGPDLNSSYVLPATVTLGTDALDISYFVNRAGLRDVSVAVTMTNTSDLEISAWEVDVVIDGGMYGETGAGVTAVNGTSVITFKNGNASIGKLAAGASKTVNFHIKSTTNGITDIEISSIRTTVPNATSHNVISIGENAYSHVATETGTTFDIESSNILYIGKNAFANNSGIRHVTLNNVVTIDNYAFSGSSITQGSFNNLNLLGTGVFRNTNNLYIMNFGKVQTMGANTITNAPYLYQVIFDSPSSPSLSIDANVFSNIGTSTENRQRFYVSNGVTTTNEEFVDVYKAHFPTQYQPYFYSYDDIVGSYIPSGLIDEIDIGDYSIKNTTINGNNGYEIVEYHGSTIDGSYQFPTLLDLNDRFLSSEVSYGTGWIEGSDYVKNVVIDITNNGTTATTAWRVTINMPNSGTISGISTDNNGAVISGNTAVLTSVTHNNIIQPGATYSLTIRVRHSISDLSVFITSISQNATSGIPVISIGDYAFGHASFDGTASYDISSDYLLNIGVSAFQNNTGIRNITANNCLYIKENAFNGASNLTAATFEGLYSIGESAFQNNANLIVINLGTVTSIAANAFLNDTNVARIIFNNTTYSSTINITIDPTAFSNCGTVIGSRLRVYVPSGTAGAMTMVEAYQEILPTELDPYVYETGIIQGSYTHNGYDIGAYSVKLANINGSTGWVLIEYHGADISSSYTIPSRIVIGEDDYFVRSIGERAYYLVNVVSGVNWNLTLPSTVVDVGDYAFYRRNVYSLSGSNLITIGAHSFEQSTTLRTITFNSVTYIEDYAFNGCTNLRTATLGTGVLSIGAYALYNSYATNNLTRININTQVPPQITETTLPARTPQSFFGYTWYTSYLYVYVPRGYTDAYSNDSLWGLQNIRQLGDTYQNFVYEIVDADVDYIKITGYLSSNNISVPDTFTISNVTYPVRQIETDAFDDVTNATTVTLGVNVMNVGNAFLSGNQYVTTINVNTNNLYFASSNGVLYSKDMETLIKVPNAKSLSGNTFTIPSTVKVIASGSFTGNTRLRRITIPSGIIAISERAFTSATNLTTVTFAGVVPPYLTGFEFLPNNAGLTINYPLDTANGNADNYANSVFYAWYLIDS